MPPPRRSPTASLAQLPRAAAPMRAQGDEYAHERQLRDFRRASTLCSKCGDRYSREHKCAQPAQLLTIRVGEHGEFLSDDTIYAMELLDYPGPGVLPPPPPADASECCLLSPHTLDGTDSAITIRLHALVGNQVMRLLLDSGSTQSFVNKFFVERIGAKTKDITPVGIRVANGDRLTCNRMVPELNLWMQRQTVGALKTGVSCAPDLCTRFGKPFGGKARRRLAGRLLPKLTTATPLQGCEEQV
ncbi:hypothetical protein D1007_22394 [Hordeum vulgare]|nr:hypothetical protein D1007_22394 [Hordeum vulgare]